MNDPKKKLVMNWSGGKDSALALHYLQQQNGFEITSLLTSVNSQHDRISMHGVRRSLLEKQASAIAILLNILEVPGELSMQDYDRLMKSKMNEIKEQDITHAAFGDIFLEDLRQYREQKLNEIDIKAVFPLWKRDTAQLVREFIALGFKTITVCVNEKFLDDSFVGRIIDEKFLADLPSTVDPCGENGEFHTFVFDGPIFSKPIEFAVGEKVKRTFESAENASWNNTFWYCDLEG